MKIIIYNFRCYSGQEPHVFNIENGKLTLIKGKSGSGKTTILFAIAWAIHGGLRGSNIKPLKIIQTNCQKGKKKTKSEELKEIEEFGASMSSTVVILKTENFTIRRRAAATSSVEIELNDGLKLTGVSADGWIEENFGSRNFWNSSSYIKQGAHNPLLSMTNSDKFSLLYELAFGKKTNSNSSPENVIEFFANALSNSRAISAKKTAEVANALDNLDYATNEIKKYPKVETKHNSKNELFEELSSHENKISKIDRQMIKLENLTETKKQLENGTKNIEKIDTRLNDDISNVQKFISTKIVNIDEKLAYGLNKLVSDMARINVENGNKLVKYIGNNWSCGGISSTTNKICVKLGELVLHILDEIESKCFIITKTDTESIKYEIAIRERNKNSKKCNDDKKIKCIYCNKTMNLKDVDICGEDKFSEIKLEDLVNEIKYRNIFEEFKNNKYVIECVEFSKHNDLEPKKAEDFMYMNNNAIEIGKFFCVLYDFGELFETCNVYDIELKNALVNNISIDYLIEMNKISKTLNICDIDSSILRLKNFVTEELEFSNEENLSKILDLSKIKYNKLTKNNYECESNFKQLEQLNNSIEKIKEEICALGNREELEKNIIELKRNIFEFESATIYKIVTERLDNAKTRLERAKDSEIKAIEITNAYAELVKFSSFVASETLKEVVNNVAKITNLVLDELFDSEYSMQIEFELVQKSIVTTSTSAGNSINLIVYHRGSEYDSINLLSGGELDRLSLALTVSIAIISGSKIVLLDETMSSVTSEQKEKCLNALKNFLPNRTIIEISHIEVPSAFYDNEIEIKL